MPVPMEFAVQMKCQSCVDKIESNLKNTKGVSSFKIIFDRGIVLVETDLPSSVIKEKLESTGSVAVLNGYGKEKPISTAVAMLGGIVGYTSNVGVQGVVRFIQADQDTCIVDGTIDGLDPGLHGLHIHECGDISRGCARLSMFALIPSVGEHLDLKETNKHGGPEEDDNNRHTGDLGNIEADENGRAMFRLEDRLVKVWDIIGRSIVVTDSKDDLGKGDHPLSLVNGNCGTRLACGVISRAAGIFENTKKICACDGVTIWDERNKPLVGPGRSNLSSTASKAQQQTCTVV